MSKKHKVKIPDGYEVESVISSDLMHYKPARKEVSIRFKPIEKELPKTWKEFRQNAHQLVGNEWLHRLMPSQYVEAFDALGKLIELRDHYNDGWKPDWEDGNQTKFVIEFAKEVACVETDSFYRHPLTLKNNGLACEFLSNFRELIETAKPLL